MNQRGASNDSLDYEAHWPFHLFLAPHFGSIKGSVVGERRAAGDCGARPQSRSYSTEL